MFERTLQLIKEENLKIIQTKNILLVGIGGVGASTLEGLIRSGFINITIVDYDTIDWSNLNRQIITTKNNIGKIKVNEARTRYKNINPNINLVTINKFLDEKNIEEIFNDNYDYIIDACDTITTKYLLIKYALEKNIKIISCMGTANRLDPSKLVITSLDKTYNDSLAKAMRSILNKNKISLKIPVIWSSEIPIKNKELGSMMMVPTTAGMLINYYIINDIISIKINQK